ncbi:GntR family transcriptional regulator [Aliigemmobacter aestuarii]|uniref:GntR family transcriptional regulator n=1 Tax=Aliigemmobacter aestuarii TaxID=1445661 RepID=A0A4S3MIH3_9RHOB|nr:GntR family transcriptional regulator [Gemmobacter aestuarii]THD80832.1 GntR family transcriptional regulator [Gemmobacter aestuarii]
MAPERSKTKGTPRTRTEKVHHALRSAIIEQRLAPGVRLPEDTIGESFGTSRTIAREALGRLAVEGLVELIPNRGAFVANPSLEEGRGIFVVRRALERAMVLELAGRIESDIAARLHEMVAREAALASHNEAEAIRLAGEFHLTLAQLTGNPLLIRYVTETVSRCSLVLAMYGRPHSADCGAREHAAVVEALIAGNAEEAAELMDRHLADVASRALLPARAQKDIREVLSAYAKDIDLD